MPEPIGHVPTPRETVEELDRYIVGQKKAKMAVAIALRNRWRRRQLDEELALEVHPKNILLIGPTGVGKTEIARRLARLAAAPFVKVEASKFTEVGYVGRDVDSMIRDLTEVAMGMVRHEHQARVLDQAEPLAEGRLLDLMLPEPSFAPTPEEPGAAEERARRRAAARDKLGSALRRGELDERYVELEMRQNFGGVFEVFSSSGIEEVGMNLRNALPGLFQGRTQRRKMTIAEARPLLVQEESEKLLDMDRVIREAIERVEQDGIVFIDEIDKIAGRESGAGPDVSREGVQRDLLPLIEGSTATTKYGPVRTDHILFMAAGAFNVARPSDMIPELQGRFPIRVDVESLGEAELVRILKEPRNSLVRQYTALLGAEGVEIEFTDEAVAEIAHLAQTMNRESVNIGARRLHTLMESLLQELSFHAPEMPGNAVTITPEYVRQRVNLEELIRAEDVRQRRRPGFHR